MPFDFPNSPSVGQRVTGVGGIVYVWDGVKWTNSVGGVTVQSMGDVGRNLIHNPLFNVAQRGAGPFSAPGYVLDRWFMGFVGGSSSVIQAILSDSNRASIGDESATHALSIAFVGTGGAGDYNQTLSRMEDVYRLSGKTVTVSFYANSSTANIKLGISMDQNFGSGGSPSANVFGAGQLVTLSATATAFGRFIVSFALPSVVGKTLGTNGDSNTQLNIWYSSGSTNATRAANVGVQSGTVNLWGVQLEIGSVATPLEKPDPRYDLANCQRFYQQIFGVMSGSVMGGAGAFYFSATLPVLMRAQPTIVIGSPAYGNASAAAAAGASQTVVAFSATASAAGVAWAQLNFSASAEL